MLTQIDICDIIISNKKMTKIFDDEHLYSVFLVFAAETLYHKKDSVSRVSFKLTVRKIDQGVNK